MEKSNKVNSIITTFIITGVFVYLFTGLTGLNLIKYYPTLRVWSVSKLDAPSMGFFGKILFSIPVATLITLIYAALYKQTSKTLGKLSCRGMAIGILIFGYFFYVAEEWHEWGITKTGLSGGGFFNTEFWFFIVITILLFASLAIPAFIYNKKKV